MRARISSALLASATLLAHPAAFAQGPDPSPSAAPSASPSPSDPGSASSQRRPADGASPSEAARPSAPTEATPPTPPAPPEEEGPSGRDIVAAYNAGFHWGLSPGVFFPAKRGDPGFMLTLDFRYGFDLGTVILAPGARVAGVFASGGRAVLSAALVRVTFPIGHFGPFVEGGAGPGYLSDPSHTGLNVYGGVGAMYYFSESFGLGVIASYDKLLGSDLGLFGVGPAIMFAF